MSENGNGSEGSESRRTAFHAIMSKTAAGFMEEAGWWWVTGFGDPSAEYRAVREGVGVWDVSPLNKWDFRGKDSLEAAQRVHSNDVLGMQTGQVRYGAFLDENGLVVDDGTVFKHADDHLWVATNGLDHEAYFADASKGLDVTVEYIAPELPHLQVQGPRSREALQPLTDVDLGSLRYFHFIPEEVQVGGVPVWLSRTGFSGELGYELFTRPEHAEDLWRVIEGTGAVPYGVDVVEPLRIEAGMVVTDYDYEAHQRTPYDLGLDRLVALDAPGAFMGKEALRVVAASPPNRFKTLRLEGEELPEYGAAVSRDGEEVGVLTSPATSPAYGPIGLAIIRSDVAADGTKVDVALADGTTGASVDVLAIHDPDKRRPRS
jgi:aminomethyltransferase